MAVDPVAALRIWSVTVEVAGQSYVIPALPAADWLEAILDENAALPIVPGMLSEEDRETLWDAVCDGEVQQVELVEANRAALEVAGGRKWWECDRLIRSSAEYWHIVGGELARLGIQVDQVPLAAVLNAIYVICVRNMDDKERNKFDLDIRRPPLGEDVEQIYDAKGAEDAFLALMAQSRPPTP